MNTPGREVYKLIARDEPDGIQGLLCVEDAGDHVFAHLLESARPNRGKAKRYAGVPGNLMAYACQLAFDKGYLGFVVFVSKSALIAHYAETLKAQVLVATEWCWTRRLRVILWTGTSPNAEMGYIAEPEDVDLVITGGKLTAEDGTPACHDREAEGEAQNRVGSSAAEHTCKAGDARLHDRNKA